LIVTSLANFSIRTKFLLTVLLTVITALLVALSSIATLSHSLASKEFRDQLDVLVDITAERSQAALAFGDKRTVTQTLQTLSKLQSIDLACMYGADGSVFANYFRFEELDCPSRSQLKQIETVENSNFYVFTDVAVKGRSIGSLYVEANGDGVKKRLTQFLMYAGLIIVFSSLIAYLLAYRLQFALTSPIIKLSNLAKEIGSKKDFSLRARVFNDDEAGNLARSFNGLIDDVQASHMQMEELVVELQDKTKLLESHTEIVEGRNKTIKNMFAGASHDLKQPLQAMVLFINALNRTSDPSQKDLLRKLELAIQNMQALFEDLLDVSKLESRLDNIETAPVRLKPMLDSVFHEFEAMAANKSLKLKFHARDFVVDSDIRMLERIIRNLLSNAIRYTTSGGVLLACRRRKGIACIEIWDTGRGIPQESMDQIFKRFYQIERKTEEGQQGYGLGLSIVKRLSEMLHHPIEVQSTFGRGTMFRVLVPIVEPAILVDAKRSDSRQRFEVSEPPLQTAPKIGDAGADKLISLPSVGTQVLLIDDDDLIRDSIAELLTSWEMAVTTFAAIDEMVTYLDGHPEYQCDVIVSDFQLSDTENGLDAVAAIRERKGRDIPALIVTGTEDPELIGLIKESGIRHLKKPVKPAKLRALINHLYANRRASE